MKKISALMLTLALGTPFVQAANKDGYKIQVKYQQPQDTMVYLAYYFGEALPKIYKVDSAKIEKGVATFSKPEKIVGGMYIVLQSNKENYFEMILNNGDDVSVTVDNASIPNKLTFKNSPLNDDFQKYITYLGERGAKIDELSKQLETAKNSIDSNYIKDNIKKLSDEVLNYRLDYIAKHPNNFISNMFNAMETPQIPEGVHYDEKGNVDSNYAYNYYKSNYFSKFNFNDDRLIHTPIYNGKLDEYFNKLVIPSPDSMNVESDRLLAKIPEGTELYKFTLWWLTRNAETSKIMGMDAAFVHLVENYYMKGKAFWLDGETLNKYYDRASKIAPNVIGNKGADFTMQTIDGKTQSLYDVKSKYTVLVFWDPTCGACRTEVPQLDSVYKAELKKKGVTVVAVRSEGDVDKWKEFVKEKNLNDWIHLYDPEYKTKFRNMYDIYSTPVIYLLDENKIIRGKRIDHTNIAGLIDALDKKTN